MKKTCFILHLQRWTGPSNCSKSMTSDTDSDKTRFGISISNRKQTQPDGEPHLNWRNCFSTTMSIPAIGIAKR